MPAFALGAPIGTDPGVPQDRPRVSGDKVVWLEDGFPGFRGVSDVVAYDLTLAARTVVKAGNADYASIYGDTAVWEDSRKPSGVYPDTDIYKYDLSLSSEAVVSNRITTQYAPDVSGTKVVWYEFVDNLTRWDIFIKDTSTGVETQLNIVDDQINPRIYGDKVVFEDLTSGKRDIIMYDISTTVLTPVTNLPGSYQFEPDIGQDKIVFSDTRNGNQDIYFYDINSPVLNGTRITTQTADQYTPAVSSDTAVWVDTRAGNQDIYGYDFSSSSVFPIVTNGAAQKQPDIDGGRVVWADYRGGPDGRIYTKTISKSGTPTVTDDGAWTDSTSTLHASWNTQPDIVDYQYSIGTSPAATDVTGWTSVGTNTQMTKNGLALADAQTYYINVIARNSSGFWSGVGSSDGILVDAQAPTDPGITGSTPATNTLTSDNTIYISWAGAADTVSGVDGFSIEWSQDTTALPDTTKDLEETDAFTTSAPRVDGTHWFNLRTVDNAGNWTSTVHYGPFLVDTSAPLTTLGTTPTVADGTNGWFKTVPQITLTPDESATTYYAIGAGADQPYIGPFAAPEGDNLISFYSADIAGNTETLANAITVKVDTGVPTDPTLSSSSHTTGTPSPTNIVEIDLANATDSISGVDGFSVSWTKDTTALPDATKDLEETDTTTTSGPLGGGSWWLNLRTVDNAGNWTSTAHLGPFVIVDNTNPTTSIGVAGTAGNNGWYISNSTITLTPDESATTYYAIGAGADQTYTVPFAAPEGENVISYFSVDTSGNTETQENTATVKVDTGVPTGSASINAGAAYTKSTAVTLNLSASDTGASGLAQMSFKDDGGSWTPPEAYSTTKSWTLPSGDGTKKVWVKYIDTAGNETPYSDTIILDTKAPTAKKVTSPQVSTRERKTTDFKVSWSASDPSLSSGIKHYDVQYKIGKKGSWRNWRTGTTARSRTFKGRAGNTYYIRARATDNAGNVSKYSKYRWTVVPYDNSQQIRSRKGFGKNEKKSKSMYYKNTLRYSVKAGDTIVYRFTGNKVYLIATKAKKRNKARIYIDGKYKRTINTNSSKSRYRQEVYNFTFSKIGTHNLKIVNVGNNDRLDLDGLGVRR